MHLSYCTIWFVTLDGSQEVPDSTLGKHVMHPTLQQCSTLNRMLVENVNSGDQEPGSVAGQKRKQVPTANAV